MSTNIPPMPDGLPPEEPTHVTDQHAAPGSQLHQGIPPEQKLVYATTPPTDADPSSRILPSGGPLWAEPPERTRRPHRSPWLVGIGGLVVGLALGLVVGLVAIPAIGSGITTRAEALAPSPFETAVEECELDFQPAYARIGDDGATLELQTEGDEANGLSFADVSCALDELDVSDAVLSRIETTRALDGRQEASWGDFTASWTYHPDNGLNMLIERAPHDES